MAKASPSLWAELRRRHVIRAAIGHVVLFWLLLQVAEVVLPYVGIIDDPIRWTVIAGIALFPVTITIAWFFEHPFHSYTNKRISIDVMVIVVIAVVATTWVLRNLPEGTLSRTSIVVLPFEILKQDSREITIQRALSFEIIGLLMKSRSIDVIGYESATSPVLAGLPIAEIISRLNVDHVLTGTVRLIGEQMQIRARLEDAFGNVLWREDLDEDLDYLFKAEEELAAGVADTLGVGDNMVSIETLSARRCEMPSDVDTLETYYTARHYLELRGDNHLDKPGESILLFETVLEDYPDFAEALSGLAWAYWVQPTYDRTTKRKVTMPIAKALAEQAYALCDNLGEAMILLPNEFDHENEWIGATQEFQAALAMQPDKSEMVNKYTRLLREVGHLQAAKKLARVAYEANPLSVRTIKIYAVVLQYMGDANDLNEADRLWELSTELGGRTQNFARWQKRQNLCGTDVDCLVELGALDEYLFPVLDELKLAFRHPESAAQADESLAAARRAFEQLPWINWFNVSACWEDHLTPLFFDVWELWETVGYEELEQHWYWPNVWLPTCGNVWNSDEFKVWANERGLVEYWRAKGWPDYCEPDGDTFSCEQPDISAWEATTE